MGKIIGIDLGTTNSCVSLTEGGETIVIPNSEGSRTTPSVVAFTEDGEQLVGHIAKRQAVTNPQNTVYAVKRLIGRKFLDTEAQKLIAYYPYTIAESPQNGDMMVSIRNKTISPSEISAAVLSRMKRIAEDYVGETIDGAVITVPAYFNDSQRQATRDAGTIAGLKVERIINEPTAAALAYGLQNKKTGIIAVFDLGGGTFDISILEINQGVFEVRSTNGDTFLGGEDFDQRIMTWLMTSFREDTGIDLAKDRMALQRLKEASEKAKHELSSVIETEINLPFIAADDGGPKHLQRKLTRAKFESLVADLIDRLEPPCLTALADAHVTIDQIGEVLLVGGMTRMPKVKEKVQAIFGKKPNDLINPDEIVAMGASIQGNILLGNNADVLLLDVTPLSMGLETMGGVFTRLIEKNTTIPTRTSQVFSTTVDNQDMVNVRVFQGERPIAADNKLLGEFQLVGIPPSPRGIPQIEVTFHIDSNGIVYVTAKDLGTAKEQSIIIKATSGLNEEQIKSIIANARSKEEEDRQRLDLIDARNTLTLTLFTLEKSYNEFGLRLDEDTKELLKDTIFRVKTGLQSEDLDEIATLSEMVKEASRQLAEKIYGESV